MISKLSRRSDARRHVVANCATSLVLFGQIETTISRAKTVQPYIEKILTLAQKGTLSARREVSRRLSDDKAVAKIFDIMVENMSLRKSGYTNIIKTKKRHGDGAPCALITLNKELFNVQETSQNSNVENTKKPIHNQKKAQTS